MRQNIPGTSWPSTSAWHSMTRTSIVTPSPETSARHDPSGRASGTVFSSISLLSRARKCVRCPRAASRPAPCQSRSSSQTRSFASTCG